MNGLPNRSYGPQFSKKLKKLFENSCLLFKNNIFSDVISQNNKNFLKSTIVVVYTMKTILFITKLLNSMDKYIQVNNEKLSITRFFLFKYL